MDGMTAMEQIDATRKEILPLIKKHGECWRDEILPSLARERIYIWKFSDLSDKDKENLREFLRTTILPLAKTPKEGFDASEIENLHVTLYVSGFVNQDSYYLVDVPTEKFGRLIRIPKSAFSPEIDQTINYNFVFLEDLMESNLDLIFPNEKNLSASKFRLTRNGEIDILDG